MKKLIVILIILTVAGGLVFFFGWMNIFVPANSYAVMVSKTSGYDDELIGPESGFVWRWQNLIPTNVSLQVFTLSDFSDQLSSKGVFPSADVYTKAVPFTPDFSYSINFAITFRLRPQALIGLVKNERLTPEGLPAFYAKQKEAISNALFEQLVGVGEKDETGLLKNPFNLEKELLARMRDSFRDIELIRLAPQGEIKIPDPAIYASARKNYLTLADEYRSLELDKMRRNRDLYELNDIQFQRTLTQLERYGELFNKYPVLLKYLFVTGGSNPAAKELPEIKDLFEGKSKE